MKLTFLAYHSFRQNLFNVVLQKPFRLEGFWFWKNFHDKDLIDNWTWFGVWTGAFTSELLIEH